MIDPLWLIPAFLVGTVTGFSCAALVAWAFDRACKDIRRGLGLE